MVKASIQLAIFGRVTHPSGMMFFDLWDDHSLGQGGRGTDGSSNLKEFNGLMVSKSE